MREILAQLVKKDAPLLLYLTVGSGSLMFILFGVVWSLHLENDDRRFTSLESRAATTDNKLEERQSRITSVENGQRELKERTDDQEARLRAVITAVDRLRSWR